ncbi:MAG TPA: cell division protein FtsB [Casimicrobiaceae bacterium]|nr:cell division protein FtsB [Casimicrobiaceae bacterium]
MRWLALAFVALIAALQYPMWLGKGGWLQVRDLDRQLAAQRESNGRLKIRNDALDAEVRDLKNGFEAVEERARAELGMVKQDEVFFQLQQPTRQPDTSVSRVASGPPASLPIRPADEPPPSP